MRSLEREKRVFDELASAIGESRDTLRVFRCSGGRDRQFQSSLERHEGTFEISQGIAEILVSTDSLVSSAQVPESLPQSKEFAKNAN